MQKTMPNTRKRNPKVKKLTIVLDSVVLVSAFVTQQGLAAELLTHAAEKTHLYTLYTAEEILNETRQVLLEREHLRTRFLYTDVQVERFITAVRGKCVVIPSLPNLQVIERDPTDDMVISCAVAAQADYIVSRDRDLLDMREYHGIRIVPPEVFVQLLRGSD